MADGYSRNGLTAEEFAALPPYEKVATMTFAEIEKVYGEEIAINVGIATDGDAWVPQEAEFSKMQTDRSGDCSIQRHQHIRRRWSILAMTIQRGA